MNKQGRLYTYNANTGSISSSASLSAKYGSNGRMIWAWLTTKNHLYVTMNKRNDDAGSVYCVNPSNGSYTQIYSSSVRVSTSPVVMSNNVIMFARLII